MSDRRAMRDQWKLGSVFTKTGEGLRADRLPRAVFLSSVSDDAMEFPFVMLQVLDMDTQGRFAPYSTFSMTHKAFAEKYRPTRPSREPETVIRLNVDAALRPPG
jgi:hypothetical protein